jgi:hypothetical protein
MNRYAIIENGVVVNVAVADAAFAEEQGWIACADECVAGWVHSGDALAPAEPDPVQRRARISPVTMRQARLALLAAGRLAQANAVLNALPPSPHKDGALIEWEYATTVRRDAPLIAAMTTALGLTDEQVDDLFVAAAAL